jgi:anti-sigma factor RsiW
VGGDLSAEEAVTLEQHLRACAGCAELARELEEDRAWLASRPPETADVDFAALRREIRKELARPRRDWKWLAVAAAIFLAIGVANMHRVAPVKLVARSEAPAAIVQPAPALPVPPKPKHRQPKPVHDANVRIELATADPDITIILLPEIRGDSQ